MVIGAVSIAVDEDGQCGDTAADLQRGRAKFAVEQAFSRTNTKGRVVIEPLPFAVVRTFAFFRSFTAAAKNDTSHECRVGIVADLAALVVGYTRPFGCFGHDQTPLGLRTSATRILACGCARRSVAEFKQLQNSSLSA